MVIVGDVYYYTISPKDAILALSVMDATRPVPIPTIPSDVVSRHSSESKRIKWVAQPLQKADLDGITTAPLSKEEIVTTISEKIQRSSFESMSSQQVPLLDADRFALDESRTQTFGTANSMQDLTPMSANSYGNDPRSATLNLQDWVRFQIGQPSSDATGMRRRTSNAQVNPESQTYLNARFFATDDDFLMNSQIRTFFKTVHSDLWLLTLIECIRR